MWIVAIFMILAGVIGCAFWAMSDDEKSIY